MSATTPDKLETGGYVVVGGGMAGARGAHALARATGETVTLVGAEPVLAYDRTALSKAFLRGEAEEAGISLYRADQWDKSGVRAHLGRTACGLEPDRKVVVLEGGAEIGYEQLLVATGRRARRLEIPGADLDGVLTLRHLADARALRDRMGTGGSLVVVGAGFVGLEVAAAGRKGGLCVQVVDVDPVPLAARLGRIVGARVRAWHEERGVVFHLGDPPEEMVGTGTVAGLRLAGGGQLGATVVVVGVGSEPCAQWVGPLERFPDGTVAVDPAGRTSAAGVWACGDVASFVHESFGRVVIEHETVAQTHARMVAMAMAGRPSRAPLVPYAWSDQYEHRLEVVGVVDPTGEVEVLEGAAGGQVVAYGRDDQVTGVAVLDVPGVASRVLSLMQAGWPLARGALAGALREAAGRAGAAASGPGGS